MEEKNKIGTKFIPILTFALVIIAVGLYGFLFMGHKDNLIQGEVEVTEVRISSKVPGRIAALLVKEGDVVRKGDTLAILSIPDVEAKLAQATAAQEGALAQNRKALAGAREQQIQSAHEMWQKAKAGLDVAEKTYQRVERLYGEGVMTAQKRDEAEANYKAYVATEKAAKAQYDLAVEGAQKEDKEAALAMVERAKGAVAEVASYVDESYLISPTDGVITEKFPNEGELVGSGAPIYNVATADKWGTFNVREDKLAQFKMDDVIRVYIPALDKEADMKIYYRKDLGTYAVWKAAKTTGSYDRKTFEVRAHFVDSNFDGSNQVIPGMSLLYKE